LDQINIVCTWKDLCIMQKEFQTHN